MKVLSKRMAARRGDARDRSPPRRVMGSQALAGSKDDARLGEGARSD